VLSPVEQWSLGYELYIGSSPVSGSSLHSERPSARAAGATSRPGAARAGNAAMTGRVMKAPDRVVVPGDTAPHPRAGPGGNRCNAVVGFVTLPATVIAAVNTVTAAAVTAGSASTPAAPARPAAAPAAAPPPQRRGRISSSCAQSYTGSSKCVRKRETKCTVRNMRVSTAHQQIFRTVRFKSMQRTN
jgi:hypothetical protein